jgi:hypothetical protein
MELGIFQKDALIEKLAKKFYAIQGYVVPRANASCQQKDFILNRLKNSRINGCLLT